ncbi:NAD(+) kinase [Leptolyngbyaceae cyanobacterium CCMR0082]|uniref:NAD kinase n=1 Tax=Adonisia turfae CCMR0082 TaxID=2304604 RepID=A0A6M0SA33_9CYAN|nr:NAD(+) kinase [Adonisia turfae]NEZ65290.1 NAD(+) kinase [Adonisia turfae CCMR0082]
MLNVTPVSNNLTSPQRRTKKVGIIYNDVKPVACQVTQELRVRLEAYGCQVATATGLGGLLGYANANKPAKFIPIESLVPKDFDDAMDFAIVLGGDGTVLSAFRQVAPAGIPLLAVNTGHMGFLTETYLNQLPHVLEQVLAGNYQVEDRTMVAVQLVRHNQPAWEALCLNEVVLNREPLTSMCHFEVTIGRHAPVDIAADGIIISTPTGSTAYSLSAGGPVITPGVSVLQLIPICPHSLAARGLVFPSAEKVIVSSANPDPLVMVVDGNAGCYVAPGDRVCLREAKYPAKFIRLKDPEFFKVLREKLGWGLPHIAKPTSVELP